MFEFEVQSPLRIRLRVGRWHLRTWRSRFMLLPKGYRGPETIYLVELLNEQGDVVAQVGAFSSERAAQECISQLEAEGRSDVVLNYVAVHDRVEDWQYDR